MRIMVVEDERLLAGALKRGLEAEGYAVDVIMLPGTNGFQVCATLRAEANWTPILMLTAKDGEYDEAEALDTGADDFLSKPFSYMVLLAHLRALLRRGARQRPAVLTVGDLRLDPASPVRPAGNRAATPHRMRVRLPRVPHAPCR